MTKKCDLRTGICSADDLDTLVDSKEGSKTTELIYIGDPMCSWCWGTEKTIKELRKRSMEKGLTFRLVAGGLRIGNKNNWDKEFKSFLLTHWEDVHEKTGQSFGYKLFERDEFIYDTEPSCRAVVVARSFLGDDKNDEKLLNFFTSAQKKFYVDNEDPNHIEFYESLCEKIAIPFKEFKAKFESQEYKDATMDEFKLNRSWGISVFPSFALKHNGKIKIIGTGAVNIDEFMLDLERALAKA